MNVKFKERKLYIEEFFRNGLHALPERLPSISFVITKDPKTTMVTVTRTI